MFQGFTYLLGSYPGPNLWMDTNCSKLFHTMDIDALYLMWGYPFENVEELRNLGAIGSRAEDIWNFLAPITVYLGSSVKGNDILPENSSQ